MEIEKIKITDIKPAEYNPRQITSEELTKLTNSINEFGLVDPIIINLKNNKIIGGHQRYEVLINQYMLDNNFYAELNLIRMGDIGWIFTETDLTLESEDHEKALNLALNKISGEWDFNKLTILLDELEMNDFDISLAGFDGLELDEFDLDSEEDYDDYDIEEDEYEIEDEDEIEVTVEEGDLYQLGNHRLYCGDSTIEENIIKLTNTSLMDLFLTDPPYNVNYTDGHDNERKIMNDAFDTDEEAGEKLWRPAFDNARKVANEYCSVYCFMPQGGTHMMMMMMMKASWQVKHELIWVKQSLVLGRQDYNYQHEPILYGWGDKHRFYGNGKYATTSVWQFDRPTKSEEHPTMKPIPLLCEILLNATKEEDNVLDLFGGSGSTLIACEETNRNCYMMELDPYYCQVIINRWETYTGEKAEKIEEK